MFNKLLSALLLTLSATSFAATTVNPNPVGLFQQVDVTIDGSDGWSFTANSAAADYSSFYTKSGACKIDSYKTSTGSTVFTGWTCSQPSVVTFITKGPGSTTCPYPGLPSEGMHLTIKNASGVAVYDKPMWYGPVCGVPLPPPPVVAVASWIAPVLTFDNSTQSQESAETGFTVRDPAYLYSQHTFIVPDNIVCSKVTRNVGTRWVKRYVEDGFTCSGKIPANSISKVVIQ